MSVVEELLHLECWYFFIMFVCWYVACIYDEDMDKQVEKRSVKVGLRREDALC